MFLLMLKSTFQLKLLRRHISKHIFVDSMERKLTAIKRKQQKLFVWTHKPREFRLSVYVVSLKCISLY